MADRSRQRPENRLPYWLEVAAVAASIVSCVTVVVGLIYAGRQLNQERRAAETGFTAAAVMAVADQQVVDAYHRLIRLDAELAGMPEAEGDAAKAARCRRAAEAVYPGPPEGERVRRMRCDMDLVYQRYGYARIIYNKESADRGIIREVLRDDLASLARMGGRLSDCYDGAQAKLTAIRKFKAKVFGGGGDEPAGLTPGPLEQPAAANRPGEAEKVMAGR